MKQNIILWTAAIIIVFVAAYYKTVTGPYYPVSGSFSIQGEKVTFKFDKISRNSKDFPVIIRTDLKDLSGYIEWKKEGSRSWNRSELKADDMILMGIIPKQPPVSVIYYQAVLIHKEKSLTIPRIEPVRLEFRHKISAAVSSMFYFFLFGGLLLGIRSGLEYFRGNSKVKALSVFTAIVFALFAFVFSPLKNSYEFGFMKDYIPSPGELFQIKEAAYFLIWIAGFIILFVIKKWRVTILVTSSILLIYFFITGY